MIHFDVNSWKKISVKSREIFNFFQYSVVFPMTNPYLIRCARYKSEVRLIIEIEHFC